MAKKKSVKAKSGASRKSKRSPNPPRSRRAARPTVKRVLAAQRGVVTRLANLRDWSGAARAAERLADTLAARALSLKSNKALEATYDALATAQADARALRADAREERRQRREREREREVEPPPEPPKKTKRPPRDYPPTPPSFLLPWKLEEEVEARFHNQEWIDALSKQWPPFEGEEGRVLSPITRLPKDDAVVSPAFDQDSMEAQQGDPRLILGFSFNDPWTNEVVGWIPVPYAPISWSDVFEMMRVLYAAFNFPAHPFRRRREGEDYRGEQKGPWRRVL